MAKVRASQAVLGVVLLVFLLASCSRDNIIQEGKEVPDFSLKDLTGKTVRLSELRGKVVLLEFWATWCEACREAVPDLIEIYKNNRDKDFEMLAVSVDEGPDAKDRVVKFINDYKINYPVMIEGIGLSKRFGVYSIPSIFIIDKKGILVRKYPGYFPDMVSRVDKEIKGLL